MQRERPLQHSMILPDTGYGTSRRPSVPTDFQPQTQLKKLPAHLEQHMMPQQPHSMMLPQRQVYTQGGYEEHAQMGRMQDPIGELLERINLLSRIVDRHDLQLGSLLNDGELSKRVLFDFRKNKSGGGGGDVVEQLLNVKLEIKDIQ